MRGFTAPSAVLFIMLRSSVLTVNLSNLNHLNIPGSLKYFCLKLLHINIREMFPIQMKLNAEDAFCLSAEQNRTNRVD